MALRFRLRVTIFSENDPWPLPELGAGPEAQTDEWPPYSMDVRLVHAESDAQQTFTMYRDGYEAYTLSGDETELLLEKISRLDKLSQREVSAPSLPPYGCDGTDYELTFQGAMNSVSFFWWETAPPGWESVGDVFDYVQELARIRSQPD